MKTVFKGIALGVLMLSLSACGFALREPQQFAPVMQTVYIHATLPASPYDSFLQNLRRVLVANNVTIVSDPKDATAIVNILSDQVSNTMVNAGGINVAGFYTASLTVQFSVTNSAGQVLLPPTSISQSQNFTSNATQILSSNFTAAQLGNAMNQEVAEELVNQLAKISEPDAAAS